ncbi:hypothetical protein AGMMS50284_4790 [Clostridia bacterium]|nr:hypothetical protein AGMMS50284_4790 [Clostridia bacterium]
MNTLSVLSSGSKSCLSVTETEENASVSDSILLLAHRGRLIKNTVRKYFLNSEDKTIKNKKALHAKSAAKVQTSSMWGGFYV